MNTSQQRLYNCINTKLYFLIFCFIFLTCMTAKSNAIACDSCGRECASACGTKHFRTCCFNYLRKRSDPPFLKSTSISSPSLTSDTGNNAGYLINNISDEQIYDPNINYHTLDQILDDIRHDSKSLEIDIRKALNTRKEEYVEKKHRIQQRQQKQQQQKELDY